MKIAVGQKCISRIGSTVTIIGSFKGLDNKTYYRGDNKCTYDFQGRIDPLKKLPEDLIS